MSGSFENRYKENFHEKADFLQESDNGLSKKDLFKLQTYETNKLSLLTNEMRSDIFYDGTVYTGSAGLAMYYLVRSFNETNDRKEMETLQTAMNYLKLDKLKGKRISFLCGDAGPLAIAMVTCYRLAQKKWTGNIPDYKSLHNRLLSLSSLLKDSPDEILYGKAGYLYALLFVNKYVSGKDAIPATHIEKVINEILQSGKDLSAKEKSSSPLLWRWHSKAYLGAAHGMAGILCMLLQAKTYINSDELQNSIKPTLEWLLMQQFPSGNFPSSLESSSGDKLVQWCHGAPGFVSLCILASKVFDDEKYMQIAVQLGEVIWQRGLIKKGYSLCHGVSGNAYAFIQLYQATKQSMYLYRARCFMEWCLLERAGTEQHEPDRPASLFEGLVGRLYLAQDLYHPMDARFPGFNV